MYSRFGRGELSGQVPTMSYVYTANVYRELRGDLQGKSAISMEKGYKNHRETLYSSKGKIAYIVEKPCNIYRLRGNPIIIMGFPRNL